LRLGGRIHRLARLLFLSILLTLIVGSSSQTSPAFRVVAFYTGQNDAAHISFVKEANTWFPRMAQQHNFQYTSTSNWANLNDQYLSQYQVIIFLDTRPENAQQRAAFEKYMKNGGSWMGFHFSAFALTPSTYNQNWDWYHKTFLGSDQYVSNTWRPTSAILKVENRTHPATKNLPATFSSSPNEWYRWKLDLTKNADIQILLSIDPKSFPLGTGPKPHEIWHSGYFPVVWSNRKFKMIYLNMGHNDMDYGGTNQALSQTFNNVQTEKLVLDSLLWLSKKR
ncbi:unnamed protein product, partial [Didymodactylos carnosus]